MAVTAHPLLAQADEFLAALLAFEAAIPEPQPDAGKLDDSKAPRLERRRPIRPLGTVIVPGSGQRVDPNVATITTPGKPTTNATNVNTNSGGPNTGSLEGLPNSGGGGGGGW